MTKKKKPTRKPRTVTGTDQTSYMLERVPRRLLEDAKAKALALTPPLTLKALLVGLLTYWTYRESLPEFAPPGGANAAGGAKAEESADRAGESPAPAAT
jgi:hypothetical protein